MSNCIGNKFVQQEYIKMFKYQINAQEKHTGSFKRENIALFFVYSLNQMDSVGNVAGQEHPVFFMSFKLDSLFSPLLSVLLIDACRVKVAAVAISPPCW